ncbi:hypothetical protein [Desulforhopalus sp. IMCC35007]|uniref:hypothetical protein n=1 Tax=Desulforhopalus sp. IMCC35007 TaxID=2569543 RepID=UPI0010AE0218|nr:hypothetical protein [Desulforhopalus sp. IMCC35007]TKB10243.1 hypothetical protein FCL48_06725 [Desulforhopalus sp. IMCC35007]
MKKFFLAVPLTLALSLNCHAENIQTEASDSLATARKFVSEGNYKKAIEEINYALAKINELTATELLKYIPEPPAGYTLINKQAQGVGTGAAIAGTAGATAEYSHSDGSNISLNIAIGGLTGKMASIAALGSIFAGLSQDAGVGQTRQIRVQGYTGTEMYNSTDQTGTLSFQIGDKTSVTFEGRSIQSADRLQDLAKNFDFAGLEKNY